MQFLRSKSARYVTGLVILFWCALFIATHVPKTPGMLAGSNLDKVFHFSAFAVLAFLCCWAVFLRGRLTPAKCFAILSFLTIYAAIDELLQLPIPGRTADPLDWLADVAGALCGVIVFSLLATLRPRFCRSV